MAGEVVGAFFGAFVEGVLGDRAGALGLQRGFHVGADFRRAQRPVVDADLVDAAVEVVAVFGLGTDLQFPRGRHRGRGGGFVDQRTVHVEALLRPVEGEGEVGPGRRGDRFGGGDVRPLPSGFSTSPKGWCS